jgi:hypothetical protein
MPVIAVITCFQVQRFIIVCLCLPCIDFSDRLFFHFCLCCPFICLKGCPAEMVQAIAMVLIQLNACSLEMNYVHLKNLYLIMQWP